AFKSEAGAESRAPMAVVVIGAIVTSTILAVFVLPAVYTLFDDLQGLLVGGRTKALAPAPGSAHAGPALAGAGISDDGRVFRVGRPSGHRGRPGAERRSSETA